MIRVERLAALVDSTGSFDQARSCRSSSPPTAAGRHAAGAGLLRAARNHTSGGGQRSLSWVCRPGSTTRLSLIRRATSSARRSSSATARAARPAAAAHRARRLALPHLARLQRLRRRPERHPRQLVPVLAPAPGLASRPDPPERGRGRPRGCAAVFALALLSVGPHPARHRCRARAPSARDFEALLRDRLPGPHRVLRAGDLRPPAPLPRRRRQPRLPAGEPVLPAGAGRP